MDSTKAKVIEENLKGFANRRRLGIVYLLANKGELSVANIADGIDLSFKATSQHLRILDRLDIVDSHKDSLLVLYKLKTPYSKLTKHILSYR